jgi:hypothetical protein
VSNPWTGRPVKSGEYRTTQAAQMTEAQLQGAIIAAAQRLGWLVYHTHDSRRSQPGYPDLHLVHEGRHLSIMRELKKQNGRLRPDQLEWLTTLDLAGHDTGVWRPIDWLNNTIAKELTA